MPRTLPTGWEAAAAAEIAQPVVLYKQVITWDWVDGYLEPHEALLLASGVKDVTYGQDTYSANGWLQGFDEIREIEGPQGDGPQIVLAGVPQAVLAAYFLQPKPRNYGEIWLGFQSANIALTVDPLLLFAGYVDTIEIDDDITEPEIRIKLRRPPLNLDRVKEYRYNTATQKLFSSYNDRGFEYIEGLANKKIIWGKVPKKQEPQKKEREKTKTQRGSRKPRR